MPSDFEVLLRVAALIEKINACVGGATDELTLAILIRRLLMFLIGCWKFPYHPPTALEPYVRIEYNSSVDSLGDTCNA